MVVKEASMQVLAFTKKLISPFKFPSFIQNISFSKSWLYLIYLFCFFAESFSVTLNGTFLGRRRPKSLDLGLTCVPPPKKRMSSVPTRIQLKLPTSNGDKTLSAQVKRKDEANLSVKQLSHKNFLISQIKLFISQIRAKEIMLCQVWIVSQAILLCL